MGVDGIVSVLSGMARRIEYLEGNLNALLRVESRLEAGCAYFESSVEGTTAHMKSQLESSADLEHSTRDILHSVTEMRMVNSEANANLESRIESSLVSVDLLCSGLDSRISKLGDIGLIHSPRRAPELTGDGSNTSVCSHCGQHSPRLDSSQTSLSETNHCVHCTPWSGLPGTKSVFQRRLSGL